MGINQRLSIAGALALTLTVGTRTASATITGPTAQAPAWITYPDLSGPGSFGPLTQPKVVLVFWDNQVDQWLTGDLPRYVWSLQPYYKWISDEYGSGVPSLVSFTPFVDDMPNNGYFAPIDSSVVANELERLIQAGQLPQNDPNTVYVVQLPPWMTVTLANQGTTCYDIAGFHAYTPFGTDASGNSLPLYYAVISDCCYEGDLTEEQCLEVTVSHELTEAITDPQPPNGLYNVQYGMEIADICDQDADTTSMDYETNMDGGSFTVQLEWSNMYNQCQSQ